MPAKPPIEMPAKKRPPIRDRVKPEMMDAATMGMAIRRRPKKKDRKQ